MHMHVVYISRILFILTILIQDLLEIFLHGTYLAVALEYMLMVDPLNQLKPSSRNLE